MFYGFKREKITKKNKVKIPVHLISLLEDEIIMTFGIDPCIYLFTNEEWINLIELELSQNDLLGLDFLKNLTINASLVKITNGQIQLTENQKKYAGITSDCIFAGALNRIEIWNPAKYIEETSKDFDLYGDIIDYCLVKKID